MLKAIDTRYRGRLFRSRLEARWAVFFDALEIEWEYESEGYVLGDGTCYLPDFWLPTFGDVGYDVESRRRGMFAEVKPWGGDFSKALRLAHDSVCPVWLCEGEPAPRCFLYAVLRPLNAYSSGPGVPNEPCVVLERGIPNCNSAFGENRMFVFPGYENDDLSLPDDWIEPHYQHAVNLALSARFA